MSNYVTENTTLRLHGIGDYNGTQDVIEYTHLANPIVNGQLLQLDSRVIQDITWTDPDIANVTLLDTWHFLGGTDLQEQPPMPSITLERIYFEPCSSKVNMEEVWSG